MRGSDNNRTTMINDTKGSTMTMNSMIREEQQLYRAAMTDGV
jgi:hypothetical protein